MKNYIRLFLPIDKYRFSSDWFRAHHRAILNHHKIKLFDRMSYLISSGSRKDHWHKVEFRKVEGLTLGRCSCEAGRNNVICCHIVITYEYHKYRK